MTIPAVKPRRPAALKLKRPEPTESAVLDAIRRALRIHPAVAWYERMNSGAHVAGEGAARRFVRYGFRGCPDIIGQLTDGRALYIEVKKPSGMVSPEQQAFLDRAQRHHAVAFVARSVSDVFGVLDKFSMGVACAKELQAKENPASQAGKPQRGSNNLDGL